MPRGKYKSKIGMVVSDKMDKTVVVDVIQIKKDSIYNKAIKRNTTFKAHDENESCHIGDKVLILETRPTSKTKRWRVSKILERSKMAEAEIAEAESGLAEAEAEITGSGAEAPEAEAVSTENVTETPEAEAENAEEHNETPEDTGGQGE